jgi:hypothetical protein
MDFDVDIDLILDDCGDLFTAAGVTQPCMVTLQDEVAGAEGQFPGQVVAMSYALVRTSSFPDLQTDDPVSVRRFNEDDFTDFRAALIQRIQDGRMMQVFLGKVQ